jgi:uncharacterized protein YqjF (DUF2071 family)
VGILFNDLSHRGYPPPDRRWAITMTWYDLLFAHWPVDAAVLAPLIPKPLVLDTFAGQAWLGVVPFGMHMGVRYLPRFPRMASFLEINVRTYVTCGGKPGVWFFSLDAASRLAVRAARRSFYLPYFDAAMSISEQDGAFTYQSRRTHRGAPSANWTATYRPIGPAFRATPGSIEDWLTNRYCLYSANPRGRVFRGEIHHDAWPLQTAEAQIESNTMPAQIQVELPTSTPLLHYVKQIDVVGWFLEAAV